MFGGGWRGWDGKSGAVRHREMLRPPEELPLGEVKTHVNDAEIQSPAVFTVAPLKHKVHIWENRARRHDFTRLGGGVALEFWFSSCPWFSLRECCKMLHKLTERAWCAWKEKTRESVFLSWQGSVRFLRKVISPWRPLKFIISFCITRCLQSVPVRGDVKSSR